MKTLDRTGRRKEDDAELIALWGEVGRNPALFECPVRPGEGRRGRFARFLAGEWPGLAAGAVVLALVPLFAHQNTRPGEDSASVSERTLGGVPFVAEPGVDGMSPGGLVDAWSAAGTPRGGDLFSLIRTGGAPGGPAPAAVKKEKVDWLSAVKNAVRAAAPAAAKTRALPTPSPKLAGALKGLIDRASGGSTRAAAEADAPRLSAPSSQGLLSALRVADSLPRPSGRAPRATAAAGTASGAPLLARLPSSGRASAADSLRDAVSAFSPSAGGAALAGAGPAVFDGARGPGATPVREGKAPGESLEFARRKMEMEKEMDLKYAKRKYNEVGRQEMLDKVKAESAAKLTETVVGKLLDGAFGLGQKGMGGGESAVAANERAEAARRRLDGSSDVLGQNGNSLANKGQELIKTDDKVLGRRLGRPVESSGVMLTRAEDAHRKVSANLSETDKSLDLTHKSIAKGNQATDKQVQGIQKYVDDTSKRIDAWNIESFNPGSSAAGQLSTGPDAQGSLGEAEGRLSQAKGQHGKAIAAASLAPPSLAANLKAVDGVIGDLPVGQKGRYASFASLQNEMATREVELQTAIKNAQTAIAERAQAVRKTEAAKEATGEVHQEASDLKLDLQQFESELGTTVGELSGLAGEYKRALALGFSVSANALKGRFESTKGKLSVGLQAREAKIGPLRQKLTDAEKQLGEAR